MAWDPGTYLRFSDLRLRPAIELLARVDLNGPRQVVDLGCGTGTSTRLLRARWPEASITGVDSSAEMLAEARAAEGVTEWVLGDLATWSPSQPVDLIFANASLQWVGDHEALMPRLFSALAPGGVLAVQMPANHGEPAHTLIRKVADSGPWQRAFDGFDPWHPPLEPGQMHRLLAPLGATLDQWDTVYLQVMEGPEAILDWVRGTALRPFLARLPDAGEAEAFERTYLEALEKAYPEFWGGHSLIPFRRRFLVGKRA
jgi:trans-aconitate 2-methyltransferase